MLGFNKAFPDLAGELGRQVHINAFCLCSDTGHVQDLAPVGEQPFQSLHKGFILKKAGFLVLPGLEQARLYDI